MRRRGITEAVVGITRDLIGESSLAYKGSALWRYLRLAEETQLVELVVDVGRGVHGWVSSPLSTLDRPFEPSFVIEHST